MGKDTFYFQHDCNARSDRKMVNLIMKHGMAGVGVYWCIVEMLYEEGGYLPLEYERITFELRSEYDIVKSVIHDFSLFNFDEKQLWSDAVLFRLNERINKSEKAKESIGKRWEYKRNTNEIRPTPSRNTKEERRGKDIYSDVFLKFYAAYPRKTAKASAWKAWKKYNGNIPPVDDLISKINEQMKTENWLKDNGQYIPHPATWLNQKRWEDEGVVLEKKSSW
jgi:hypothetical protein